MVALNGVVMNIHNQLRDIIMLAQQTLERTGWLERGRFTYLGGRFTYLDILFPSVDRVLSLLSATRVCRVISELYRQEAGMIEGTERKATEACGEYLALLERMVTTFKADHAG
jgi:hypothetical protein